MLEYKNLFSIKNNFNKYTHVKSRLKKGHFFKENTLISIVIPTYKRAEYLKEAVDSALNQDINEKYYVIVVDNNSEEKSQVEKVINSYADERLIYFKNDENIGMFGNWNRCVELAPSEYIVMLHDDDLISSNLLTQYKKNINLRRDIDAIGCNMVPSRINEKFKIDDSCGYFDTYITELKAEDYLIVCPTTVLGMCIKKNVFMELGGYNDSLYPISDTIFLLNLINKYKVVSINKGVLYYRIGINTSLQYKVKKCFLNFRKELIHILGKNNIENILMNGYIRQISEFYNMDISDIIQLYSDLGVVYSEKAGLEYQKICKENRASYYNRGILSYLGKMKEGTPILIWGAGELGHLFYARYKHRCNIKAFIDTNYKIIRNDLEEDISIESPTILKKSKKCILIIASFNGHLSIEKEANNYGYFLNKNLYKFFG